MHDTKIGMLVEKRLFSDSSCSKGLSWLVAENNDMSFFQLFQYCLGSGLGTIGDYSSEQLLRDPLIFSSLTISSIKKCVYAHIC